MSRLTARHTALTALAVVALFPSVTAGAAMAEPHEYLIVPVHSQKCLDVLDADPGDDADIVQWTCDGRVSQRFSAAPSDDGTWLFWSQATGRCLQAAPATQEGGDVLQRTCDGGTVQRWRVEGEGAYGYQLVSDHTGQCLEVEYASHDDGAEVRQYPCHGQANQRFSFDGVPA